LVFCLVALLVARGQPDNHFPLMFAFFTSLCISGLLYCLLFLLMDVRFPGTRAVQSILSAAAANRHPA